MFTPKQLVAQLADLGIDRSERNLTDWRQKGLLPPLKRVGRGRGSGTENVWESDVLDQAVAVDFALSQFKRAWVAQLQLWMTGFEIDHLAAQEAWIRQLKKRRKHSIETKAGKSFDYARVRSKALKGIPEHLSDVGYVQDFYAETPLWLFDTESDDESYRLLIAEVFAGQAKQSRKREFPSKGMYEILEIIWEVLSIPTVFRNDQAVSLVASMTPAELSQVHGNLRLLRELLQHWFLISQSSTRLQAVQVTQLFLSRMIGPLYARTAVAISREHEDIPLEATICELHQYVMEVKSEDIEIQEKWQFQLSKRAKRRWQVATQRIANLWSEFPRKTT